MVLCFITFSLKFRSFYYTSMSRGKLSRAISFSTQHSPNHNRLVRLSSARPIVLILDLQLEHIIELITSHGGFPS